MISTVRPNLQAFGYVEYENTENCIASTGFAVLDIHSSYSSKFVYYSLFQENLSAQIVSTMGKGAYPSINQKDIENLQIPLPPLSVQEEIVAEIEGYQTEIEKLKKEIERKEQKIKDKISEVWGE